MTIPEALIIPVLGKPTWPSANFMTEANAQSELKEQLLSLVADRLMTGEVLISEAHFQQVMEEGFEALSGRKNVILDV